LAYLKGDLQKNLNVTIISLSGRAGCGHPEIIAKGKENEFERDTRTSDSCPSGGHNICGRTVLCGIGDSKPSSDPLLDAWIGNVLDVSLYVVGQASAQAQMTKRLGRGHK